MFGSNITNGEGSVPIINSGVPLDSPPSYEKLFPLSTLAPVFDPTATSTSNFKAEPLAPTDVKSEIPWKTIAIWTILIGAVILTAVSISCLGLGAAVAAVSGLWIAVGLGLGVIFCLAPLPTADVIIE